MNNQPEIANILVDSNAPTITDKLTVLSKEALANKEVIKAYLGGDDEDGNN